MGNLLSFGVLSAASSAEQAPIPATPANRSGNGWKCPAVTVSDDRHSKSAPFGYWLDDPNTMVVCVDLDRIDRPPRAGDRLIGWGIDGAGIFVREFICSVAGIARPIRAKPCDAGASVEDVRFAALVVGRYRPE